MLINIFSPHLIDVIKTWIRNLKILCCANCFAQSEADLEKIYEPVPFQYAARCGALLNTVFSTVVFCPGLPVLVWFLLFNNLLTYWCDKYVMLRIAARPPCYDETVMRKTLGWLPTAFFLHGAVGVWMLGNVETFPSNRIFSVETTLSFVGLAREDESGSGTGLAGQGATVAEVKRQDLGNIGTFISRAFTWAGLPYLLLMLLVVSNTIVRAVGKLVAQSLKPFLNMFCAPCMNRVSEKVLDSSAALEEGDGVVSKSLQASKHITGSLVSIGVTSSNLKREGFAEDETTWTEQKSIWQELKVCAGYSLAEHPEWCELLVGTKMHKSKKKDAEAAKDAEKEAVLTGERGEKNSSTAIDDGSSEATEDWESSSTEIDDE